ncbi:MAG TPA: hypothetical protein VFR19_14480 [Hyphomicrobiaceae bacterium]|jgi:hypothetical protein|nr:hypothetical protein [Hyphomicrobiaceae bacterium]
MLLASLLVEDVIADPPKLAGDTSTIETSAIDRSAPVDKTSPPSLATAEPRVSAAAAADRSAFDAFLDRLMHAESGGRDTAANPRSTALGPYQFIKATFLDLARRHFGVEVQELSEEEILRLRTDRSFARRCAETYSRENLTFLAEQGLQPTFGHLRLAFLVGPFAAARVLQAAPATPVAEVLGSAVIRANPFMARMSTSNLIARTSREVGESVHEVDIAPHVRVAAAQPAPVVQSRPVARALSARHACNPKLASCRKFAEMQARVAKLGRHVVKVNRLRRVAKVAPSHTLRALGASRRSTADTRRRGAGA